MYKDQYHLKAGEIIVTGGAGFIGSALVHALNQRGIRDIWVVDYLNNDQRFKNLVPLRYIDYIEADDFLDLIETSGDAFKNVKTVFHLGACSSTTETDVDYLMQNNTLYTQVLADWCLKRGVRFVYASSAATYGDGARGMSDEADLDVLRPMNPYGYSKHRFDVYAKQQGFLSDIIGLKYFNVYGPNEAHKGDMRSMVAKAFDQIQVTGKVRLFKSEHPDYRDGEQMRDFLYIKDAVNMTLFLAENLQASGLYNIGSGQAHTWNQLMAAIFQALNREISIEYVPLPDHLKTQYQYYTCSDNKRLRDLGYVIPVTPLDVAVKDYVQNYLLTGHALGY